MSISALLLVSFGGCFAVVYLLGAYVKLETKIPFTNKTWSPRLFIAKHILGPMDAGVTLILVGGGWVGLSSAMGISSMIFNVLSGIGLSLGVMLVKKFFTPRWEKEYKLKKESSSHHAMI